MKTKHTQQAKGGGSINKVTPTGSPDRSEKQIHLPVYPPLPPGIRCIDTFVRRGICAEWLQTTSLQGPCF